MPIFCCSNNLLTKGEPTLFWDRRLKGWKEFWQNKTILSKKILKKLCLLIELIYQTALLFTKVTNNKWIRRESILFTLIVGFGVVKLIVETCLKGAESRDTNVVGRESRGNNVPGWEWLVQLESGCWSLRNMLHIVAIISDQSVKRTVQFKFMLHCYFNSVDYLRRFLLCFDHLGLIFPLGLYNPSFHALASSLRVY